MRRSGDFIQKQGLFLLEHEKYAWFLTALLAVIPFTASVSLAVMALVTLRKGWFAGLKCLLVCITVSICLAEISVAIPILPFDLLLTALTCYLSACLLRATVSWKVVAGFVVMVATLAVLSIHWFAPDYITAQYKAIADILGSMDQNSAVASLFEHQPIDGRANLANYLLGIRAISLMLSAMLSLIMARALQASLFNPGGFKKEMLAFRASSAGVIFFVIAALGAYQNNPILLSCLPIFFVYLMTAGITFSLNVLAKKRRLAILVLLLAPIILAPHVMLPVYVLFGSIDSLFNLRSRLLSIAGDNQNKG